MSDSKAVQPSLDGQGGTETKPELKKGPRYIYYRVYTRNGALESNNPIYSNDCFISRTVPKSVPPPHTAASLKKHLCKIEGLKVSITCSLYLSLSDQTPVEDSVRVPLRGTHGPGESELDPLALVVDVSYVEKRSKVSSEEVKDLMEWPGRRSYVYYRVYDEGSDIPSKTSFDGTDPSLGRIDALFVPPPHTVPSLKSCLTHAEGVSLDGRCQLFEDEGGESTMNDGDTISLLSDSYLGVSEDEPIAIVYEPQEGDTSAAIPPSFTMKLRAKFNNAYLEDRDSRWHNTTTGEIFQTDGVLTLDHIGNGDYIDCYVAINSSGKRGFVVSGHADFC